jgi:hypothetical protein
MKPAISQLVDRALRRAMFFLTRLCRNYFSIERRALDPFTSQTVRMLQRPSPRNFDALLRLY